MARKPRAASIEHLETVQQEPAPGTPEGKFGGGKGVYTHTEPSNYPPGKQIGKFLLEGTLSPPSHVSCACYRQHGVGVKGESFGAGLPGVLS